MSVIDIPKALSVTEAATRGVPRLVKDAELGADVVVERHGRAVAAVVSIRHLDELRRLESDLRDAALVLARIATDDGKRTDLDDVLAHFDLSRADLEREIADEAAVDGV